MNIQLKIEDSRWKGFISGLSKGLGDVNTLFKKAFLIVWPRESADHFDQELGFDGPWAQWSPSYAQFMERIGKGGNKLLQDTGRLRTQTVQNPILTSLPNGLKVESETPYSGFLDEGTSKMPARPFMWLGDESQDRLAKILVDGLFLQAGGTD